MTRTPSCQRQRSRDDGRRRLSHGVPDDGARGDPVGLHCGRQRYLHGEQGRLHLVNAGHGLRRRHRLGHREPGLGGNQRFHRRDGGGEHGFVGEQVGAHRRPLRTLPREDPYWTPVVLPHRALIRNIPLRDLTQPLDQLLKTSSDDRRAHRPVGTAARQRISQIR